jgi:4-amino-4-deoxy-L-arabinose transferase-like glycosyltransferase
MALGMVALLPRLFVAIAWAREPVWDGHYYHVGATRIAAGLGYSEDVLSHGVLVWKPWTHYPVGYSALLSLFYRVLGDHLLVAPLLNAVLGAATAILVHRIALPYIGLTRSRVAGGIAALHPGLIAYCPLVMTEIPTAFLLVLLVWTLLRFRGQWHAAVGESPISPGDHGIRHVSSSPSARYVPFEYLPRAPSWIEQRD